MKIISWSKSILEEKDKGVSALRSKQCPSCTESDKHDLKLCAKCRLALTYNAYDETIDQKQIKDKEVENLRNQMQLCKKHSAKY